MVDNIISSLGAGSGINSSQLVKDLVALERAPTEERLDSNKAKLDAQVSGYGAMRSAVSTLQDSLTLLKDADTFNAKTVAFPTTDVLTPVEIKPDALPGDYQIEVLEVAQAQSTTSTTFSSTSDTVGKGTLTFNFGVWDDGAGGEGFTRFVADADATSKTITIDDSNNTLTGLRDAINEADFGVQATIVADGSDFRLLISAPSGASNEVEIVIAEDGGTPTDNDGSDLSRFAFNTAGSQLTANQGGVDASLKINGFGVTRDSNQIDDVVEGLEFTLNKKSVGEVISFSISNDTSTAQQSIRDFISAYNDFFDTAKDLVTVPTSDDEEETNSGSLSTDPSAKTVLNQVRSIINSTVTGADTTFNALAFAGIKTELDGKLSIDEDSFTAAIDDNYALLTQLFSPSASSTDSKIEVAQFKDATKAGSFAVNITAQPSKGNLAADTLVNNGPTFDYDVGVGTFSTAFTPSSPDYDFKVAVNGTSSDTLTLSGSFTTLTEVRDELQVLINGDSALQGVGAAVDVTIVGDSLQFESRQYGTSSKVIFSDQGTGLDNLGFGAAQGTASIGSAVAGTINGESAFGAGNILLPEIGSDLAGLSLRITPGATTATITHSRGFGVELNNLLDEFLSNSGLISDREASIESKLEDIKDDRLSLDARMEKRFALLQAQFIQMEAILGTLSTTSDSLDGLLDRLPFTATKS